MRSSLLILLIAGAAAPTTTVTAFTVSHPRTSGAFNHQRQRHAPSSLLFASTELITTTTNTLATIGPLDIGLFLIPFSALIIRASALNDRRDLEIEIEATQEFLVQAKERLVKVEKAIQVRRNRIHTLEMIAQLSSAAGVVSFACVLAFQLGLFPSFSSSTTASTASTAIMTPVKESPLVEDEKENEKVASNSIQNWLQKQESNIEKSLVKEKDEEEEDTSITSSSVRNEQQQEEGKANEKSATVNNNKKETPNEEEKKKDTVKEEATSPTDNNSQDEITSTLYNNVMKKIEASSDNDEKDMVNEASEETKTKAVVANDEEKQTGDKVEEERKAKDFVELEGGML